MVEEEEKMKRRRRSVAQLSGGERQSAIGRCQGDLVCKFSGCISVGSRRDLWRINRQARIEGGGEEGRSHFSGVLLLGRQCTGVRGRTTDIRVLCVSIPLSFPLLSFFSTFR